jgi:CO/xanthine dehydrogenase Mo-binding subunit
VMPELEVYIIQSFDPPGGRGEHWTSQIVAAVANGIFAATGKCFSKLPVDTIALKQPVNGSGAKNPF